MTKQLTERSYDAELIRRLYLDLAKIVEGVRGAEAFTALCNVLGQVIRTSPNAPVIFAEAVPIIAAAAGIAYEVAVDTLDEEEPDAKSLN